MRIEVERRDGLPIMLLTAENDAEEFQLQAMKGQLIWGNVSWAEFSAKVETCNGENEGRLGLNFGLRQ